MARSIDTMNQNTQVISIAPTQRELPITRLEKEGKKKMENFSKAKFIINNCTENTPVMIDKFHMGPQFMKKVIE